MQLKITIEGDPGAGKTLIARHIANYLADFHVQLFDNDELTLPTEWGNKDNPNKCVITCHRIRTNFRESMTALRPNELVVSR